MTDEGEEVADAESFDEEEEYDEEEEEEDLLFGRIPRTPGLIAFGAIGIVILLLLAAMFIPSFGLTSSITELSVSIPGGQGDYTDTKLDVEATTGTPIFGKNAEGDGDLSIIYNNETVYKTTIHFIDGRGTKEVSYENFYVDNGEYKAQVDFKGKSAYDTITLMRTGHSIVMAQNSYKEGTSDNEKTSVVYKFSLFPDDTHQDNSNIIYTQGHGYIEVFYVKHKDEQDNEDNWQFVTNITYTTDFSYFKYKFQGESEQNESIQFGYRMVFDSSKIHDKNGDGYYTARISFFNDYGLEDKGAFRDRIHTMPVDSTDENGQTTSSKWIPLPEDYDK